MLRKGTLQAREPVAGADGTYLAVTLLNRPPHGVMAWAGRMHARAIEKAPGEVTLGDYNMAEKVSFCRWQDVWDYFAGRQYAELVGQLRREVEALYPGES
jgi:hypothetical protein